MNHVPHLARSCPISPQQPDHRRWCTSRANWRPAQAAACRMTLLARSSCLGQPPSRRRAPATSRGSHCQCRCCNGNISSSLRSSRVFPIPVHCMHTFIRNVLFVSLSSRSLLSSLTVLRTSLPQAAGALKVAEAGPQGSAPPGRDRSAEAGLVVFDSRPAAVQGAAVQMPGGVGVDGNVTWAV